MAYVRVFLESIAVEDRFWLCKQVRHRFADLASVFCHILAEFVDPRRISALESLASRHTAHLLLTGEMRVSMHHSLGPCVATLGA